MRRAVVALGVAAVGCRGDRAPEVALTEVAVHPVYRVRAELPAGWVAEATHAPIYPADLWSLHPAGPIGAPSVTLILGWLPRGGRQSAFFPGDRDDDAHPATLTIGGVARTGTSERGGHSFKLDFEVGELAVSISTLVSDDAQRATVEAVLARLAFDAAARPPGPPTPARRALDLARRWAGEHGYPADGLAYVGLAAGTPLHAFTLFHPRGLVALRVDVAAGTVAQAPL